MRVCGCMKSVCVYFCVWGGKGVRVCVCVKINQKNTKMTCICIQTDIPLWATYGQTIFYKYQCYLVATLHETGIIYELCKYCFSTKNKDDNIHNREAQLITQFEVSHGSQFQNIRIDVKKP